MICITLEGVIYPPVVYPVLEDTGFPVFSRISLSVSGGRSELICF